MIGKYGVILEIAENPKFEVLLMVPDLQTEARLALVFDRESKSYYVGWQNWNGLRTDGLTKLRWTEVFSREENATANFWNRMDKGPIRFKTPKKPNYNSARFNRWINECVYPIYESEPILDAAEATKFAKMVWDSEQNTGKRLVVLHDIHRRAASYNARVHVYELVLPKWARRKDALLMLVSNILCHGGKHHDPTNVRKLVYLYVKYLNRSEAVLLSELDDYGVKVAPK